MKKLQPYLITVLVLLGLALRLTGAADRPLDGDEGVILLIANGDISHVLHLAARDVHPPLFHLLTSVSLAVGDVSRLTLRLVSILAGTVLIAFGPALARRFKTNELLVTTLLATSPFLVNLSQDARMYSLLVCLTVASWLLLMNLWDATNGKTQDNAKTAGWVAWAIVSLLMLATHHLGWLVLLAELVASLLWHRAMFRRPWQWLGAVGLIIVGYLPLVSLTVHQVVGRLSETSLHLSVGQRLVYLVGAFYRMVAGRTFLALTPDRLLAMANDHPLQFGLFLVTIATPFTLVGLGKLHLAITDRPRAWNWAVLAGVPVVAALLIATIADQAPRYLSFLAPVALALIAVGLVEVWASWWGKLLALGLIATTVAGLWTQLMIHDRAPGTNAYAAALKRQFIGSDTVLIRGAFADGETTAFRYEASRIGLATIDLPSAEGGDASDRLVVDDLFGDYTTGNLGELRSVSPGERVNLIDRQFHPRVWFYDQTYEADPLAGLDPSNRVTRQTLGTDKEGMPLTLYLIERSGSSR